MVPVVGEQTGSLQAGQHSAVCSEASPVRCSAAAFKAQNSAQ